MQKQWEALGYDVNSAAALITQWFDYSFSWPMLILTAIAVIGYFGFLLIYSDKEYKQVIAEKFD